LLLFLLKRTGQMLVVLLIVTVIAFALLRMAPGNPARMLLPDTATEEDVRQMEIYLGLDKPLPVQYFKYMGGILKGDLGRSFIYARPVADVISERMPFTIRLAIGTVLFGTMLCVPLGIIAGANRGKTSDFFAMFFALLGQSMSAVWLAVLCIFVFSVWLGWLPALGSDSWQCYIMPVITMGYGMAAEITRVGRSGMIDTLGEDFITATYAKGVKRNAVNWKYAFRNAMSPVVTLICMTLAGSLAGAVVVEVIFSISGVGQMMVQAVGNRDYALVQSMMLVSAIIFTVVNFLIDIINSLVDPRLRLMDT
jgi:peptide/nickel transport system permease protein